MPAVLTNAVRYATPDGAVTVDVLDAARRLVPLDAAPRRPGERRGVPRRRRPHGRGRARGGRGRRGRRQRHAALLADTEALAPALPARLPGRPRDRLGALPRGRTCSAWNRTQSADAVLRKQCEARIG